MKIAFLGDIHLYMSKMPVGEVYPKVLEDKIKSLKYFTNYVLENDIKKVFILGDIFHKTNPSQLLRDLFLKSISELLKNKDIFVYVVLGNHDTNWVTTNLLEEFKILKSLNNFYIEKTIEIEIDSYKYTIAPYGTLSKYLMGSDVLITHNGIEGGVVGFYDLPLEETQYSKKDLNKKFKLVIAGHYHKPQHFSLGSCEVCYVGSTTCIDFAEREERKRFIVLDSEDLSYESIEFPVYTKFIQIDVKDGSDVFDVINSYEESLKDSLLKLNFIGSKVWFSSINMLGLKKFLTENHEVFHYYISVNLDQQEQVENINTTNKSPKQILEDYIEELDLDDKDSIDFANSIIDKITNSNISEEE